jgi:DNA-binding transcriptional LysR family regulator
MEWLNYHHLLYFWQVAKEGSVSRAAAALHVAQPTVSAQLRSLERALRQRLFDRQGRRLVLTPEGEAVFRYADEIFSLGRELLQTVKGEPAPCRRSPPTGSSSPRWPCSPPSASTCGSARRKPCSASSPSTPSTS